MRVGVRGSKLAIAYAERVCNELPCDTEIVIIKTLGDLNPDVPIHEIGGKGVFCSAIENALFNNEIDIAVHSLKDMPGDVEHPDLEISAVLQRSSPYDVLLGKVFDGSTIGTSSPRRTAQLTQLYPNSKILPIRGNIDSRLNKLDNGQYDAIILAQAGLDALNIHRDDITILPIGPAVGQGIIALQTRQNSEASKIAKQVNHTLTFAQAQLERALLKGIAGDCQTRIAAHATGSNPIKLEAVYYTENL
jgi:hydroxymethylbilane synthase